MTKDVVKTNGQVAKKLVKESEDKKPNGEEIVDKQVRPTAFSVDKPRPITLIEEGDPQNSEKF